MSIGISASFGFYSIPGYPGDVLRLLGLYPDGSLTGSVTSGDGSSWWVISDIVSDDFNEHIRYLLERFDGKEHLIQAEWNPRLELSLPRYCPPEGRVFQPDVLGMMARCKATFILK